MLHNSICLKAVEKGNKMEKRRNSFCLALCKDKATDSKGQIQTYGLCLVRLVFPIAFDGLQRSIGIQNQCKILWSVQ